MKRIWSMIFASVLLLGSLAVAGSSGVDPKNLTADSIAGVVILGVDGIPQQLMFISALGKVAVVAPTTCHLDAACSALEAELLREGKVDSLSLNGGQHI